MSYLALYFLVGAIVAVWTAINNLKMTEQGDTDDLPRLSRKSLVAACVLIALAWPLSVGVFFYAILTALFRRERPEDGL